MKTYLPTEYLEKACYQINNDYIRVWETTNKNYDNTYYDIYFKNDYMVKQSSGSFYSSSICESTTSFTDNIIYRYDFANILVALFIMLILFLYFPGKVVFSFFRRFRI